MGCEDSAAQGGHYFTDPVMVDPWITAQYSSDAEGSTKFGAALEMGTIDLDGRAFVVHAEDGSRVGCGILEMVAAQDYLVADMTSLGDSSATGSVTALPVAGTDMICYMGYGSGLEPNLSAFYSSTAAGPNCTATNGCGTHVHAGTSCESSETQMGHYYTGDSDPWAIVGYESTSADGTATFMDCISTGETFYEMKPFIIHADNGSRVACGLLGPGGPNIQPDEPDEPIVVPSYEAYHATITPIPGVDSPVSGTVVVFTNTADGTTVGYGGHVTGLQPGLEASSCTATNGCGVHIHSGMGCEDSAAQGGHYFTDPVMVDPWITAQYSSDADGSTKFAAALEMGTVDVEGRAFVVHAEDGSRVGCGILTKVMSPLEADLESLGSSNNATGSVAAVQVGDSDTICYMGYAMNLEPSLSAFYSSTAGPDCTATNGCGTHVHAGTSCESSDTQMGHYYTGDSDPWAIIGYESTSSQGFATYMDCISTGETDYEGKAFIVHSNSGGRVACGLLEGTGSPPATDGPAPTVAPVVMTPPTDAPVAATTDAPVAAPTEESAGSTASVVVAIASSFVGLSMALLA